MTPIPRPLGPDQQNDVGTGKPVSWVNNFIPLNAVERQVRSVRHEIDQAISAVLDKSRFILGDFTRRFEDDFASFCGTKYSLAVGSGTDALTLSLKACGVGPGDEVLVPANSFVATAEAVTHAGARPIFVDADAKTFNIDLSRASVTKRTKAIIPVHLYGRPAEMDEISEFAAKNNLKVIEDACQAHGATYKGKKVGSLGDVGCFSFFPTKPLSALGDGGAVTTGDPEIMGKIQQLRNHGRVDLNVHATIGYTSRLDELQASILSVKLRHVDEWTTARRKLAREYFEALSNLKEVKLPAFPESIDHVFHLFVIRIRRRDLLKLELSKNGIESSIHYPTPIHRQPSYSKEWNGGRLYQSERLSKEILSLPMFAELTDEELHRTCHTIRTFVKARLSSR